MKQQKRIANELSCDICWLSLFFPLSHYQQLKLKGFHLLLIVLKSQGTMKSIRATDSVIFSIVYNDFWKNNIVRWSVWIIYYQSPLNSQVIIWINIIACLAYNVWMHIHITRSKVSRFLFFELCHNGFTYTILLTIPFCSHSVNIWVRLLCWGKG